MSLSFDALTLDDSHTNLIIDNDIFSQTNNGLTIGTSLYNTVTLNRVFYNTNGLEIINGSSNNYIINNTVYSNGIMGIRLIGSSVSSNEVMSNDCFNNMRGIDVNATFGNFINYNNIYFHLKCLCFLKSSLIDGYTWLLSLIITPRNGYCLSFLLSIVLHLQ